MLVAAQRPGCSLQMLHEFYEPGRDPGRRELSHDGEECAVVVAGTLEITVGEEVFVLGRGDAYYFDSATPHRLRNVGSTVSEVVSACTPPSF